MRGEPNSIGATPASIPVRPQRRLKARDVLIPDLHVDPIKVKAHDLRCAVLMRTALERLVGPAWIFDSRAFQSDARHIRSP
jgi:hypothetical protein